MDIFQLKEFTTLVGSMSYSETAAALDVSTSALSRHILALENELGGKLFDRTTRTVKLTELGAVFLPHAVMILQEYEEGVGAVSRFFLQQEHSLTLGVISSMREYDVSKIMIEFSKAHPDYSISTVTGTIGELEGMFRKGQINLFTAVKNTDMEDIRFFRYGKSVIRAMVPASSPLAAHSSLSLEEIAPQPLLLMDKNTIFWKSIYDYFSSLGIVPKVSFRGEMIESLDFVRAGLGIALFPFDSKKTASYEGIAVIDVYPEIAFEYGLGYRKKLTPAEKLFVDFVSDNKR